MAAIARASIEDDLDLVAVLKTTGEVAIEAELTLGDHEEQPRRRDSNEIVPATGLATEAGAVQIRRLRRPVADDPASGLNRPLGRQSCPRHLPDARWR